MRFYYPIDNVHFSDFGVPQVFPLSFQCVPNLFPRFVNKKFLCSLQVPNVPNVFPKGCSPRVFPIAPHFNPICLAQSPPPSIECWTTETCAVNWVLKSCCCKYDGSFGARERKRKCMCNFFLVKLKDLVGFS